VRIFLFCLFLAFALGGCAIFDNSDQGTAGITRAEIRFCPIESGNTYVCSLVLVDGKQRASVLLKYDREAGKLHYNSTDVEAFSGQAKRAEVEKVLIESGFKAGSDALGKMLRLLAPLP
tara:strand:- start:461 stop:817 length:357 start_codon:yes stop_codon:yes gene_type:complete